MNTSKASNNISSPDSPVNGLRPRVADQKYMSLDPFLAQHDMISARHQALRLYVRELQGVHAPWCVESGATTTKLRWG